MRSPELVAMAALAFFAVAACGGSSAAPAGATPTAAPVGATTIPAPAGGTVDMCALLSPADLKTVTGKDYGAGVLDSLGRCSWNVGGTGVNTGDEVVAAIQDQPLSFISTFQGGVDVTVSGHAGYWNPAQGLQSIWVDVGGRLLVLSFPSSRTLGPDDQAIAQKLAEIAISKM